MSLEKEIQEITNRFIDNDYFNTVDLLFQHQNRQLVRLRYSNGQWSNQLEDRLIFDLASLTKIVTTTGILKLITENKLTLNSSLKEILPLDKSLLEEIGSITVIELLTHSSGLRAWFPFYSLHTTRDLLEALKTIELRHEQEDEPVYSDLNYMLLGEVIQRVTGMGLQTFLTKEIKEPLNLPTLTYGPIKKENIVPTEFGNKIEMKMCEDRGLHFHRWRPVHRAITGEVNDGNAHYFFKGQAGHAGLFGSVEDLVGLLDVYMQSSLNDDSNYIVRHLLTESLKNQVETRGLGWHSGNPFPSGFGHTGFTGTSVWLDPLRELKGVILTNRLNVEHPKDLNDFRYQVHKHIINFV